MSGQNLIIARNPTGKRRSAAQKAASKRNIKKAQRANRGGRRRTPAKRKRRRNPSARGSYRRPAKRRSNPRMPTFQGIINNQLIPAAVGGAGAVLDDILVNFVPIPANFKVGYLRHVTKAIGAILIGYVGGMFLNKKTADQLGAGAMTVVGYNVARDLAAQFMPQLALGEYLDPTMGMYLDPTGLGYYGAGLDPSAVPGAGLEVAHQFTRGSPYVDPAMGGLDTWPTGGSYEDLDTSNY